MPKPLYFYQEFSQLANYIIEKATLQMKAFSEQASDNRVAAEKLKEQMGQSAKSLSSLNKVYGGMLSAMSKS